MTDKAHHWAFFQRECSSHFFTFLINCARFSGSDFMIWSNSANFPGRKKTFVIPNLNSFSLRPRALNRACRKTTFDIKYCYTPPLIGRGIKRWCCLTFVCLTSVWRLSVAYIGPKSRTERPRKTKIGQRYPMSPCRTPLSRSKGHRSRSPGRFIHRGVNASGSCSGERGNVLSVGTYCYVAAGTVVSAARGASAPTEGGEGRGHIVTAARLQLVIYVCDITFSVNDNIFKKNEQE